MVKKEMTCCPKCGATDVLIKQGDRLVTCGNCYTLYQWVDENAIEIQITKAFTGPTDHAVDNYCPKCAANHWCMETTKGKPVTATCLDCGAVFALFDGEWLEITEEEGPTGPTNYAIANAQAAEERIECLRSALQLIKEHAKMGNSTLCFSAAFNALNADDVKIGKK